MSFIIGAAIALPRVVDSARRSSADRALLSDSRNHAIERLRMAALEKGANALVAMRFDCNEIANLMSEMAAYGTAVTIRKK
jgi:uncharacterized protein YbjQ (UPF0145 family)